jgi:hypothetical protein
MRTPKIFIALGLVAGAALVYAAAVGPQLVVNGKVASTDVRVIGGKAYVPIADVAKALDMQVTKSAGGYTLAPAGGANMMKGNATGKMGEEIFTGKWRFKVLGVERMKKYVETMRVLSPRDYEANPGEELVVVSCRVKNGTKQKDELVYSIDWEGTMNALTDMQEHSYQPIAFDVKESETAPIGVVFLPGAAVDFKMIFRVPEGTELKDLVFTALRYSMRTRGDQKQEAPQHIRVSLK